MEKETLATEIIREENERRENIIWELECMDADFDKTLFLLEEIMESIDIKLPKTEEDVCGLCRGIERIDILVGMAHDYISRVQSCISDIVVRERKRDK